MAKTGGEGLVENLDDFRTIALPIELGTSEGRTQAPPVILVMLTGPTKLT